MLYVKWLFFMLSEKFMDILNLFTAPIVVLFARADGWLPSWLSWWQTPDNSLDGDEPWQAGRRPFAKNTGICRYLNRVAWLYRNSMYGYANQVVGVKKDATYLLTTNFGTPRGVSGKPPDYERDGGAPLSWRLYDGQRLVAFQMYWLWPWSAKKCLRLNIGWKLWDWYNPLWNSCNCVLSFNPWKSMEG